MRSRSCNTMKSCYDVAIDAYNSADWWMIELTKVSSFLKKSGADEETVAYVDDAIFDLCKVCDSLSIVTDFDGVVKANIDDGEGEDGIDDGGEVRESELH